MEPRYPPELHVVVCGPLLWLNEQAPGILYLADSESIFRPLLLAHVINFEQLESLARVVAKGFLG